MNTDKVKSLAMNDNGFIFDPASGFSYSANGTGLYIMKQLGAGLSKEQIIAQIMEDYEVREDDCASDLEHYFLMLESLDLIER